jgi:ABC-type enterochelin transport system substrate-binding protein
MTYRSSLAQNIENGHPACRRECHLSPHKVASMKIPAMLLCFFLVLTACSNGTAQDSEAVKERLQTLENRVAELEKKHTEDMEAIRQDLRSILRYFDIALDNMDRQGTMSESLRRGWEGLKEETQRLLEKLQKELEGMGKDQGQSLPQSQS